MVGATSYIDIGYNTTREFWDEIVLAAAGRFKTDPTRAHAMAVAIYVSHFLDWVFHEKHPREDTFGNPIYVAFKQRHHRACPELAWLEDLADVAKHRGIGRRPVRLKKREGEEGPEDSATHAPQAVSASPLMLELNDGTHHPFDQVTERAIAYWRANR